MEADMKRLTLFLAAALILTAAAANAFVRPAGLFTDNAVLQQGMPIPVWGMATKDEQVTVTFAGQTVSTVAKDGKWMVKFKPVKAGGPYKMTIAGENVIDLNNILVGEVWICSGQSNMEFHLYTASNGAEAIKDSADPMLRLFTVPKKTSYTPVDDVTASWQPCSPETSPAFSAVGYFFGRDLRKALNVPVGLINSSWGGTYAQAWTSPEGMQTNEEFARIYAEGMNRKGDGPNNPCVLYNGMIHPLQPFAFRGVIWYQGEANAGAAYQYRTLFPTMIKSWRNAWGEGDFPFLFVQLAPFMKINPEPEESTWAELREAQLLTTFDTPKTGMAVITDVGNPDDIHPKQKEPVGDRLALAARAIAYRQKLVFSGPIYKSMKVKGSEAIISFNYVGSGLEAKDGDLKGFTIAGEDKKFVNATAKIVGKTVVVSSPQVPNPVAVRYGWANCPVVNLYNKEGIPASPFRTDDFQMLTAPKK